MLLQHTLRNQAERQPDAVAVVFDEQRLTYRELEQRSNQLARLLKEVGCQPGDRVGLLLQKSIPALVGMLGALKAECIYVPMDTGSPAARLRKIIDVCEPSCILAANSTKTLLGQLLTDDLTRNFTQVGWMERSSAIDADSNVSFCWDDLAWFHPHRGRQREPVRPCPYPVHLRLHRGPERSDDHSLERYSLPAMGRRVFRHNCLGPHFLPPSSALRSIHVRCVGNFSRRSSTAPSSA